jgi:hypothetical protein
MANPFETFAYRQTAPTAAAVKGNPPQKVTASDRPPRSPTDPPPNRRTRRQCPQPSMPSDSDIKQQQVVSPVAQTSHQAAIRSSPRVKQPRSTALSPAAKKRKAYASLTGPPKGLGPKLGTSPLRLILVSMLPALELSCRFPGWQVTVRSPMRCCPAGGTQPFRACIPHRTLLQQPFK